MVAIGAGPALRRQETQLKEGLDIMRHDGLTSFVDIALGKTHSEDTSTQAKSGYEALKDPLAAASATSLNRFRAESRSFYGATGAQSIADVAAALLRLNTAAGKPLLQASE